jgi:iron(III) transport system ATP-binding protein
MLTVEDLHKSYRSDRPSKLRRRSSGSTEQTRSFAVHDVGFEVKQGELFTFLGPSGCGKTTTLRSIAGLERPDSGRIALLGEPLFDSALGVNVAVNKRGIGMVFQSYAIWPHMTVWRNVEFPFRVMSRRRRPAAAKVKERIERVLDVTGLAEYADRPATKLSGGQQQRLALARALVIEPELLLLDEPLSNLDATLRESMRFELKRLQRESGVTTLYVTHDQSEALVLSNRIAVMSNGEIVQIGAPRDIYGAPASKFVAEFIGISNFIEGVVTGKSDAGTTLQAQDRTLVTSRPVEAGVGDRVLVTVRPESYVLSLEPQANAVNRWTGKVVNRAFLGDGSVHVVAVGQTEVRVQGDADLSIAPGTEVHLTVHPDRVVPIPL